MYSFAGAGSPFGWLRLLPGFLSTDRLWLRRCIDWSLKHVHGVDSYYSLYSIPRHVLMHLDLPARGDLFAAAGIEGARSISDDAAASGGAWAVWDYRMDERHAFDELERRLKRPRELLIVGANRLHGGDDHAPWRGRGGHEDRAQQHRDHGPASRGGHAHLKPLAAEGLVSTAYSSR